MILPPDLAKAVFKNRRKSKVWYFICDYCGGLILTSSHSRKREWHGFCDDVCHSRWRSRRAKKNWQDEVYRANQARASARPEVRKARSEAAKRRPPLSPESREKAAAKCRGPLHPRWKGGDDSTVDGYRRSRAWRMKRKEITKRDEYTCQACGVTREELIESDDYDSLDVHHCFPLEAWVRKGSDPKDYPDEWLATLCRSCHTTTNHQKNEFKHPTPAQKRTPKDGFPRRADDSSFTP